jgi:hypothetical protein
MKQALILVLATFMLGDSLPTLTPPKTPPSLTMEQRIELMGLRISAFKVLVNRLNAERREQEAEKMLALATIDRGTYQHQLDEWNSKIDAKMAEIRELCMAKESDWDLTDDFEWVRPQLKLKPMTGEKK